MRLNGLLRALRGVLSGLLVAAFALAGGPVAVAADGERVVICGAAGAVKVVLFDFETGAPVEEETRWVSCDHCLSAALTPKPPILPPAQPAAAPGVAGDAVIPPFQVPSPRSRGPPPRAADRNALT